MINDNYWQTETGWMISCNYGDLTRFDTKPGSATKPCPGHELKIFDEDNKEVK
jgi:propionyl-CoA synthetase